VAAIESRRLFMKLDADSTVNLQQGRKWCRVLKSDQFLANMTTKIFYPRRMK